MPNFNYGSGFYVMETTQSCYNLYNAVTDKEILSGESLEVIKSFLDLNCPTHPILFDDSNFCNTYKVTIPTDNSFPPDSIDSSYNSCFNNDADYLYTNASYYSCLSEDDLSKGSSPVQLSFDFMNDNNNKEDNSNVEDITKYLPDYEDQNKRII